LHQQAFCALTASPGARTYYDALRARRKGHNAALRQLANRLVDILHGCLKSGSHYDERTALAHLIDAEVAGVSGRDDLLGSGRPGDRRLAGVVLARFRVR